MVFEDGFESADNDFIDDSAKFHSGWELDSGESVRLPLRRGGWLDSALRQSSF